MPDAGKILVGMIELRHASQIYHRSREHDRWAPCGLDPRARKSRWTTKLGEVSSESAVSSMLRGSFLRDKSRVLKIDILPLLRQYRRLKSGLLISAFRVQVPGRSPRCWALMLEMHHIGWKGSPRSNEGSLFDSYLIATAMESMEHMRSGTSAFPQHRY